MTRARERHDAKEATSDFLSLFVRLIGIQLPFSDIQALPK